MSLQKELASLQQEIVRSERCPRLVEYRQKVAREKRRAYKDWDYWGKPVPSFGEHTARLLIVGLAPAAHGGNRTGRIFTGDRSGDFLFETLYRTGFCNQSSSKHRDDGLRLKDAYITAAVHCCPPDNKPAQEELVNCRDYLKRELQLLREIRVVVPLGKVAWDAYLATRRDLEWPLPSPLPKFGHGLAYELDEKTKLIGSYHPSQQNTQTGKLTRAMFDSIFKKARKFLE